MDRLTWDVLPANDGPDRLGRHGRGRGETILTTSPWSAAAHVTTLFMTEPAGRPSNVAAINQQGKDAPCSFIA